MLSITRLLILVFLISFTTTAIAQNNLTIQVNNIKNRVGKITMSIFNKKESHLKDGKAFRTVTFAVKKHVESMTFQNIPNGEYSVVVYQDLNNDGVCNRSLIGIPTEPYAFSNNFKPRVSAPSFDDVKVKLNSKSKIININLIH